MALRLSSRSSSRRIVALSALALAGSPPATAQAFADCPVLERAGDRSLLTPTDASESDHFATIGCVSFEPNTAQGPVMWYRGTATISAAAALADHADPDASAEIHLRVGEFALIIATARVTPAGVQLSSPTAGDAFATTTYPVDDTGTSRLQFEITNYLQESALLPGDRPITIGFRNYGLELTQVQLESGQLDVTDDPPYPLAIALGDATDVQIDVLVSLKNPDDFDELELSYAVDGASTRSANLADYTTYDDNHHVREYSIPLGACDEPCTLDVQASSGDQTAGGRFSLTSRDEPQSFVNWALVVIGLLALVEAARIYLRSRSLEPAPAQPHPAGANRTREPEAVEASRSATH